MRGSCLCGAVVYEVDRLYMSILHCHCATCRKAHSAPFPRPRAYTGSISAVSGEETLSSYESSPGKLRRFCSMCGSHLLADRAFQPHVVLRVATLDENPHAHPKAHIWVSHDVAWLEYGAAVPSYPSMPSPEEIDQ